MCVLLTILYNSNSIAEFSKNTIIWLETKEVSGPKITVEMAGVRGLQTPAR